MYYTIIPPCLLFFCCVVLMVVLPIQARARADHLWCGWRFVLRILGERLAANGENWSTAMVRITCLLMVIFCCHDEACLLEAAWSFPLHVLSASSEVLKSHSFFLISCLLFLPFIFRPPPPERAMYNQAIDGMFQWLVVKGSDGLTYLNNLVMTSTSGASE